MATVAKGAESQAERIDSAVIRLYAVLPQTRALGPFLRFALWVQGCRRNCPGCMTPNARPLEGGCLVEIDRLAADILRTPDIEGVTISGGEPFLQSTALSRLIRRIRARRDLGVILYTGYTVEELREEGAAGLPGIGGLLGQIDLLIDGPYLEPLNDGLSLRGSANQRIHCLTDRYTEPANRLYGRPGRDVELHYLSDGPFLAGIPGPDTLKKWRNKGLLKRPNPKS
ncbi:MAG: 4Fe-4S single cluster domain-containing protein [Thermodesulfobacteriota bacterium]